MAQVVQGIGCGLVVLMMACRDAPSPREPEAPAKGLTTSTAETMPACCARPDEIDQLAGKSVRLVGVYQAKVIAQRGDAKPDLSKAGAAGVLSESGRLVMLGVYHEADGVRSIEERQRHDGKRVEVVGILERRTPVSIGSDGQPEATMIDPYVHSIKSIRLVD
ncbi:hypothetical protein [Nannocystis radixulma]|uniref:Lipoprotein n=1 Tax=Nannocystis radixulma TaxID=2995305 RepID=A0ABT5B7E9_9BACT|nr:hypothetical protein [Nannocystis radixulma]MDC0670046.1 hypothetical protein [Nannocystis radixulma]